MRFEGSGVASVLANARPPRSAKFANAPLSGLTRRANAAVAQAGFAQLELTDALHILIQSLFAFLL